MEGTTVPPAGVFRLSEWLGLAAEGEERGQVCCLDKHNGGSFHVDCGLWRRKLGSRMVCGHNRMVFVDGRPSGLTLECRGARLRASLGTIGWAAG